MLPLRRVLLADDDLDVRNGVEELLSPLGLEFLRAESGLQALAIARERLAQLDLMVLDLHMPGCTGLDVLTSLRGESAALRVPPCIVYSGSSDRDLEGRALAAGAWAFLRKPVQPDQLRGEVLRALRR
jgi:CheY-like chemotaxis protein